ELRANRRLTPERACAAANTYSAYFEDVCKLQIQVTCGASTRVRRQDDCRTGAVADYAHLTHLFARSSASKKVYWSTYNASDKSPLAQSLWEPIPELENSLELLGGVPFKTLL